MRKPFSLRAERARLLGLLREHKTQLAACRNELRSSTDAVDAVEDLESIQNRESHGLGAAMASIQSRTVQLIETSLRRLETGSYGRCCECDGPIAWVRLQALPFAETCRDCQERRDQASGAFPVLV